MALLQTWGRGRGPLCDGQVNAQDRPGPRAAPAPRRSVTVHLVDSFGLQRSERDGCAVVAVEGEVDLATAPRLREALAAVVAEGHLRVVVDLSATEFLDSTGLGALVTGLKRVRARGGDMKVVCTSPRVCKVFEITSIDKVVPVCASLDEACAGA